MAILDKIKDTLTPHALQVYYGPNRGTAEWLAKGEFGWGCGPCAGQSKDTGGWTATLGEAQRNAVDHAKTHRGARAVYGDG